MAILPSLSSLPGFSTGKRPPQHLPSSHSRGLGSPSAVTASGRPLLLQPRVELSASSSRSETDQFGTACGIPRAGPPSKPIEQERMPHAPFPMPHATAPGPCPTPLPHPLSGLEKLALGSSTPHSKSKLFSTVCLLSWGFRALSICGLYPTTSKNLQLPTATVESADTQILQLATRSVESMHTPPQTPKQMGPICRKLRIRWQTQKRWGTL